MNKSTMNCILFLAILMMAGSCSAPSKYRDFYDDKKRDSRLAITAPRWIALAFIPAEEKQVIRDMSRGIRRIRLLYDRDSSELIHDLDIFLQSERFDNYFYLKNDGSTLRLHTYGNQEYMYDFVLSTEIDEQTVIVALEGKMNMDDFTSLLEREILLPTSEE